MRRAVGAGGFVVAVRAFGDAFFGVLRQLAAFIAQIRLGVVDVAAIHADHQLYGFIFAVEASV